MPKEERNFHYTGDIPSRAETYMDVGHILLRDDLKRILDIHLPDFERDPEAFATGYIIGVTAVLERITDGRLTMGMFYRRKPEQGSAAPESKE